MLYEVYYSGSLVYTLHCVFSKVKLRKIQSNPDILSFGKFKQQNNWQQFPPPSLVPNINLQKPTLLRS